jgi:hypothetical protein
VDRRASPSSPRNPHIFQGGSASICSRACVRRNLKHPQRATNSECQPSGSSASHHRAPPTHGPPHTSFGSSPRLPGYIRAQGPREVHAMRRALEPQYSGPYQVLSRRDKTLLLLVHGRPVTVSTDRAKPAYILNQTIRGNNSTPPAIANPAIAPPATPPQSPTKTKRFGRYIHFPSCFNILAFISAGGG